MGEKITFFINTQLVFYFTGPNFRNYIVKEYWEGKSYEKPQNIRQLADFGAGVTDLSDFRIL